MVEENNYQEELVEVAMQKIQESARSNGLTYREAHDGEIRFMRRLGASEEQIMPLYKEALRILEEKGSNNDHEDKAWPVLRKNLQKQINKEAAETIDRESEDVINLLTDPSKGRLKRKGLVVGYVQSGKTANFSAVITKAVDEGYRLVIVMTGIHEALRSQTQTRLKNDVVSAVSSTKKNVVSLTYVESDLYSDDASNLEASLRAEDSVVYAVVKKNHKCLEHLLNQIKDVNQKDLLKCAPVLIIDDESDQATPNTAGKTADYAKINGDIRQSWDQVQQGSYVAYTATPFANVFMDPNDEKRYPEFVKSGDADKPEGEIIERYPGLYPSDFIYALGCPKGYIGASHFFGADRENADGMTVDAVREIAEDEVENLRPPTKKEKQAGEKYKPKMVSSLKDAVCWFMIATALRRNRTQEKQHSSMLVHLSQLTESHSEVEKVIKKFISKLQQSCKKGKIKKQKINKRMQRLYEDEVKRMQDIHPEGVYPDWHALLPNVVQVICETKCIVRNSSSNDELDYNDNSYTPYVVIGGNALSRGLTLEGLISSYFIRGGKTYDALLQMGRWFGFRSGYEDLVRLWTTKEIEQFYRYLVKIEDDTRKKIREIEDPSKIAVEIRADSKKLKVTSRNKMRNARFVDNNYSGKSYQVTEFEERNNKILNNNIQALESLINSVGRTHEALRVEDNGSYLFEAVPVTTILTYLKDFEVRSSNHEVGPDRLLEWIDKNVATSWNLVIYSDTRKTKPRRNFAGLEIRMADRSAVKSSSTEGLVDIKSLANPDTYRLDLRILAYHGKLKISETDLKNKSGSKFRSQNGNFPLLAVYVINPKSKATKHNRRDLNASAPVVLHAIMLPEIVADTKKSVSVHHLMRGKVEPEEEE